MAERALLIGLTGGIGTGKSKVSELLESLGAVVECSDKIVRELQAKGGPGLEAIVREWGAEYLTASGELDRAKLGALVFADPKARLKLNAIIHPLVTDQYRKRVVKHTKNGVRFIVLDIPLLLEGKKAGVGTGAVLPFDSIVVVYATEAQQLARVMARDGLTEEAAKARIASQLSIEEKRQMADVVIDNTGDWAATEKQVRELFASWSR